eukprot:7021614-Pyramimonas_sp.AAC.1
MQRAAQRRALLWIPYRRRLVLKGLRMDGEGHQAGTERHPNMIMDGLRQHWQPTFTDRPVDINAVDDYLRTHLPEFDSPALEVPSPTALRAALLRAKPTAPGPDRLPAAAWLADPRL